MNKVGVVYERPWGTYQTLALEAGFQVKTLSVNPGGCLSLQRHQHRDEHWVVVQGEPTVTLGDSRQVYQSNQQIFVPKGEVHRIHNESNEQVVIVEVQVGDYLGEDDIERLDDIYDRQ